LERDLVDAAEAQELPVTEENIEIKKWHIEEHDELRVDIAYSVPITTPVTVYEWKQLFRYQAPTFD